MAHDFFIGGVRFIGTDAEETRLRALHAEQMAANAPAPKEVAPATVKHEAPKAHAPAHKVGHKKK
jgi:hypothetical protein